jgi:hypothetical protein
MIDAHRRGDATARSLAFVVEGRQGSEALGFDVDRLVCCGWSGRDSSALQAHIDELAHLGVPPPTRVPIYMNLSPGLLTQADEMQVVSGTTSGARSSTCCSAGAASSCAAGQRASLDERCIRRRRSRRCARRRSSCAGCRMVRSAPVGRCSFPEPSRLPAGWATVTATGAGRPGDRSIRGGYRVTTLAQHV